jgi:hypothetical protein
VGPAASKSRRSPVLAGGPRPLCHGQDGQPGQGFGAQAWDSQQGDPGQSGRDPCRRVDKNGFPR